MMNERSPIRVAVIGAGVFGRNHARVYSELQRAQRHSEGTHPTASPAVELAAIVDPNQARARALLAELGSSAAVFASVADLLREPSLAIQAASVAVPTASHLEVARPLMQAGVDVLIEKPIATSLAEANELEAQAQQTGRIAMAGHLERFNPAVRATLPLITTPMFFEVHRLSVFTPRSLDVDVVLDLMIHDLDIVLWLGRSPVREIRAVGIPILSDKVDIANVRLEFESGCVANFTASRVFTERVRKLRFFQPGQYVSLDYTRRDVFTLSVKPAFEGGKDPRANDLAPEVPGFDIALPSGIRIVPGRPRIPGSSQSGRNQPEEPLHAELTSFLRAVRERTPPPVTLADGRAALDIALQILDEIARHASRAGLRGS